jgi:hypothetical protein
MCLFILEEEILTFAGCADWLTTMTGLAVTNVASSSMQVASALIFQRHYVNHFFIAMNKQMHYVCHISSISAQGWVFTSDSRLWASLWPDYILGYI